MARTFVVMLSSFSEESYNGFLGAWHRSSLDPKFIRCTSLPPSPYLRSTLVFLHFAVAPLISKKKLTLKKRERSRSPRRRSRSPGRQSRRRSFSPRSRSNSRDDYRRGRDRSPMTGTGAPSGGTSTGYGGQASHRSLEDRAVAREQMMSSIRETSQQERRVYVGNLAYDVKWHHLKDFMRQGRIGRFVAK